MRGWACVHWSRDGSRTSTDAAVEDGVDRQPFRSRCSSYFVETPSGRNTPVAIGDRMRTPLAISSLLLALTLGVLIGITADQYFKLRTFRDYFLQQRRYAARLGTR